MKRVFLFLLTNMAIMLVLMDEDYEPFEIREASREVVLASIAGKSLNRRGAMSVAQFRIIAELVWSRDADR